METWYRAAFGKIGEVEILRSTHNFVVFPNGRKEAIDSEWQWYRRDRDQAKAAMVEQYEKNVRSIQCRLWAAEDTLAQAKNA